jgi:hypothetical protein
MQTNTGTTQERALALLLKRSNGKLSARIGNNLKFNDEDKPQITQAVSSANMMYEGRRSFPFYIEGGRVHWSRQWLIDNNFNPIKPNEKVKQLLNPEVF